MQRIIQTAVGVLIGIIIALSYPVLAITINGVSGGSPCTTTALSIQFNSAGAFGCTTATWDAANVRAIFPATDCTNNGFITVNGAAAGVGYVGGSNLSLCAGGSERMRVGSDILINNNGGGTFIVTGHAAFGCNGGACGSTPTLADAEIGIQRVALSASAPGGNWGKFAFACGTNAGTAKIVAYAGTSATPVTVVDNVGTGVTGC